MVNNKLICDINVNIQDCGFIFQEEEIFYKDSYVLQGLDGFYEQKTVSAEIGLKIKNEFLDNSNIDYVIANYDDITEELGIKYSQLPELKLSTQLKILRDYRYRIDV